MDDSRRLILAKRLSGLDGTNPQSLTVLIPESATVNSGFVSISPDDDGFESPVTVSVAGSSISGDPGTQPSQAFSARHRFLE